MRNTCPQKPIIITLIFFVLAAGYGCTGCLIASSAAVGAGAAEGGVTRVDLGKVKSFEIAAYDEVIKASRHAAEVLSLDLEEELIQEDRASFRYRDETSQRVDLIIEPRTDTVTAIKIDVGIFGSSGMALLMLQQIRNELNRF